MRRHRDGIPRVVALSAAALVAVLGLLLLRGSGGREAAAAPQGTQLTREERAEKAGLAPEEQGERAPTGGELAGEGSTESPNEAGIAPETRVDRAGNEVSTGAKAASEGRVEGASARAKSAETGTKSAPKRAAAPARKPASRPAGTGSLPPLAPPPDWGSDAAATYEEQSGPPPGVLWLSGVIQGDPRVAVLRRGEKRYVVREGDTIESKYKVAAIGTNTVTLARGSKKQTLRVGAY